MKKTGIALSALCLLSTPFVHAKPEQAKAAQTPAAPLIKNDLGDFQQKNHQKRFVDPLKILPNAKPWIDGAQQLEVDLRGRAQQIEEMMKTYGTKEQELRNSANVITPTVKEAKAKELLRLQNNIEIEKQAFEQHRMQRMQELEARIGNQVCAAAKKYAEANDIDEIAAAGFIYCKPSLDVSNEVLAILNQIYDEETKKPAAQAKAPVKVASASATKPTSQVAAPAA